MNAQEAGARVAEAQLAERLPPLSPLLPRLWSAAPGGPAAVLAALAASPAPPPAPRRPAELRAEHADLLGLQAEDLAFRSLYPTLDHGLYTSSHSMGVPSLLGPAAVADTLQQVAAIGIGVWDEGYWSELMARYEAACSELVGGQDGDLVWYPNVSEALGALLEALPGGRLVFSSGHFTTGHYVHHQWAQNTGGRLVEVSVDEDGALPPERLLAAVDAETTVVSISHALFESGWLQDLPLLAAEVRRRAPDAMLLVDAYQTAGTVPIDATALGDHVVVTAGAHKQLRGTCGAAFTYLPRRWSGLQARRAGWWGHAAPFSFEKGAIRRPDSGLRFRTGTPTVPMMAMLIGELAALASGADGTITGGVRRAREVTRGLVDVALTVAAREGLGVRGAWGAEQRAAYVVLHVPEGERLTRRLAEEGISVDFRPVRANCRDGYIRVSGNAAGFGYEIEAVLTRLGALLRQD